MRHFYRTSPQDGSADFRPVALNPPDSCCNSHRYTLCIC